MLRYIGLRFCVLAGCSLVICEGNRAKRQSSLDDLIHTALSFVRPILDTSQVIQDSPVIPRKVSMTENIGRETEILGAPKYANFMDIPVCRGGQSQICRFISCTAHNFKYDQNFANLNLAAQLLEDKKMRQVISSNPEAVITACHEQGLSIEQCRLFSRGFQLIGRFMNKIEDPVDTPVSNSVNDSDNVDFKPVEVEAYTVPQKQQHVVNLSMPRNAQLGSHTWSTRRRVFDSPKPMKQIIRHSTTNRSQPLGLTEAPPTRNRKSPKAQRPPLSEAVHVQTATQKHVKTYQTTETQRSRVPPRPRKLPELEEEEVTDYDYNDETLARPRAKRADDYYEELGPVSTTQSSRREKPAATKMNCLQYLGGL